MAAKHDWNSWDHYQDSHLRRIQDYADYFILRDALVATMARAEVRWWGVLYCVDGLEIRVTEGQEVRYRSGQPQVQTVEYRYHVLRREDGKTINLFRYDNIHQQPGHPDSHHKHRFDAQGTETEPPTHVGADGWPTLGDVIEEAYEWWLRWRGGQQGRED